jgi:hypothetical protein
MGAIAMWKNCVLPLFAGLALLGSATPAQALLSVRYDGTALIRFESSNGRPDPGAMNGDFSFTAIFYYDDLGEQQAASLIVADVLRAHYTGCPGLGPGACQPLAPTATSIGSNTGTTPEDYIGMSIFSPGGFGGVPLPGPLPRIYDLIPEDASTAYLSWALYDNASGFAWNSGSGSINRLTLAVPEPMSWLMMLTGFGFIGARLRRQKQIVAA